MESSSASISYSTSVCDTTTRQKSHGAPQPLPPHILIGTARRNAATGKRVPRCSWPGAFRSAGADPFIPVGPVCSASGWLPTLLASERTMLRRAKRSKQQTRVCAPGFVSSCRAPATGSMASDPGRRCQISPSSPDADNAPRARLAQPPIPLACVAISANFSADCKKMMSSRGSWTSHGSQSAKSGLRRIPWHHFGAPAPQASARAHAHSCMTSAGTKVPERKPVLRILVPANSRPRIPKSICSPKAIHARTHCRRCVNFRSP